MRRVLLLGPQRLEPIVADIFAREGLTGPVATITAGWQEREGEVDELAEHLGLEVRNLYLHRKAEEVFAADPELFTAYRSRQNRLRQLQEMYRQRLDHAQEAARGLLGREEEAWLIDPERRSAIRAVRALDRHHLERVAEVREEFRDRWRPRERDAVAVHREELRQTLSGCAALAIAGGHVAVLLNRLRLFGVLDLARDLPVVAWSAGAMVLGERIVLFHDRPPQGMGNAEVLDQGLGLFSGALPLPHARRRLKLGDPVRVALFARRFAPDACVAMDERALAKPGPKGWELENCRVLEPAGTVREEAA